MKDAASRQAKIEAMRAVGDKIAALDKAGVRSRAGTQALAAGIPNIPDGRTPYGKDDSENVVLRTVGALPELIFSRSRIGTWDRRSVSSTSSAASRSPVRVSMCSAAPGRASSGP